MSLIHLEKGQSINPAQVVSYTKYKNGDALFNLTDGTQIIGGAPEDFEYNFFPTIPAASGFYEIFADVQEDLSRHWYRRAIVGWQLTPGGNYPVLEGRIDWKDSVGQFYPDGTCVDVDGNRYDSLHALKSAIADEDFKFLAKAYPDKKEVSTAFKITNTHLIDPDGEKILMVAGHALEGGWSLPFGIVIESHDQAKQDNGQIELSALVEAIGMTDLADEQQLIGKFAVIHLEKIGRERFSAYVDVAKAA